MTTKVRVVRRRTATDDITRIYDRITARADPDTAFAYTSSIEAHTADLATYHHRGTPRDAIAPSVGTLSFRGRTVIAYRVTAVVAVLRVFHAGPELGLAVCLGVVAPVTVIPELPEADGYRLSG